MARCSICRTLALENLNEIGYCMRNDESRQRGLEWYTLFFAFQSALTLLLSVVWEPRHAESLLWRDVSNSFSL